MPELFQDLFLLIASGSVSFCCCFICSLPCGSLLPITQSLSPFMSVIPVITQAHRCTFWKWFWTHCIGKWTLFSFTWFSYVCRMLYNEPWVWICYSSLYCAGCVSGAILEYLRVAWARILFCKMHFPLWCMSACGYKYIKGLSYQLNQARNHNHVIR